MANRFGRTCQSIFIFFALLIVLSARSITLEGKTYKCPGRNLTFQCDAAKRVPAKFNIGTWYKIKDLMNPSTDKKLEIYCNETRCMVKKNELDGRVKVLETNAKRMIFQLPNLDDSLRISCKIDTEAQYLFDEYHASDITTVECVHSCIGQQTNLSCQGFQQFLQNPSGLGAFLKRLGATEDIFFCNDKANCTCMNGCGQYSGRLRPGDRSVKLSNIKKEDADVEFLFHFENEPRKQAPKSCIFKIDPEFCSGTPTKTPTDENPHIWIQQPRVRSTTIAHNLAPGLAKVTKEMLPLVIILTILVFL